MAKFYTDMKILKRILVITNDSSVFTEPKRLLSAYEMFGGRVTEVKNLVARLDTAETETGSKLCDVSFGIITSHYGFVPANYMITGYEYTMDKPEVYKEVDEKKDYVSVVSFLTKPFDKVIFCIPKEMFRLFLDADYIENGKVIAVTCPEFKEECEKRGWTFLERKGARVGEQNADEIERIVRELCSPASPSQ